MPSMATGVDVHTSNGERERVLALLRRHGFNTTSFQALEDGLAYWWHDDDACVAYAASRSAWVAAGAPIAAHERIELVARAFVDAARANGRRAVFFASQARLASLEHFTSVQVGLQPVWDPRAWPQAVERSRSLREQLRRATAKGVVVRYAGAQELAEPGSHTRHAIERLVQRWLATRGMSPMSFLVRVEPFTFLDERRVFVAERDGTIVAFLGAIPVYARDGWFVEDLVRDPQAPNGTMELLVDAAMRGAAAEGSTWVTLGLAPLAGDVPAWMSHIAWLSRPLYDFAGLHAFKAKLAPSAWEPVYVTHPRSVATPLAVTDALRAFAGGSVSSFVLRTLFDGPAVVLWALAVLLVPWTIALALADTQTWFPSRGVQLTWVLFDSVICVTMFALAHRFRPRLGTLAALAVSADALLTLVQAFGWNAARIDGALELLVVLAGCAAPLFAAVVLWRCSARARKLAPAHTP